MCLDFQKLKGRRADATHLNLLPGMPKHEGQHALLFCFAPSKYRRKDKWSPQTRMANGSVTLLLERWHLHPDAVADERWHRFKDTALRHGFSIKHSSADIEVFATPRTVGQYFYILFLDYFLNNATLHEIVVYPKQSKLIRTKTFRNVEHLENWLDHHPSDRRVA